MDPQLPGPCGGCSGTGTVTGALMWRRARRPPRFAYRWRFAHGGQGVSHFSGACVMFSGTSRPLCSKGAARRSGERRLRAFGCRPPARAEAGRVARTRAGRAPRAAPGGARASPCGACRRVGVCQCLRRLRPLLPERLQPRRSCGGLWLGLAGWGGALTGCRTTSSLSSRGRLASVALPGPPRRVWPVHSGRGAVCRRSSAPVGRLNARRSVPLGLAMPSSSGGGPGRVCMRCGRSSRAAAGLESRPYGNRATRARLLLPSAAWARAPLVRGWSRR